MKAKKSRSGVKKEKKGRGMSGKPCSYFKMCENVIPEARLEAVPDAQYCVECQSYMEKWEERRNTWPNSEDWKVGDIEHANLEDELDEISVYEPGEDPGPVQKVIAPKKGSTIKVFDDDDGKWIKQVVEKVDVEEDLILTPDYEVALGDGGAWKFVSGLNRFSVGEFVQEKEGSERVGRIVALAKVKVVVGEIEPP